MAEGQRWHVVLDHVDQVARQAIQSICFNTNKKQKTNKVPLKANAICPPSLPLCCTDSVTFRPLLALEGGLLPGLLLGVGPFDRPTPPHIIVGMLGGMLAGPLLPGVVVSSIPAAGMRPMLPLLGRGVGTVLLALWLREWQCHVRLLHVVGGGGVPGLLWLVLGVMANVIHHHGTRVPDRDPMATAKDLGGDGDLVQIGRFVGDQERVRNV